MTYVNSLFIGPVRGTLLGDNAPAGAVGERVEVSASGVAIANATQTNIASLTLTPGDWEVSGTVAFTPAATTTVTGYEASLGTVSATINNTNGFYGMTGFPAGNVPGNTYRDTAVINPVRFNVTVATVVYLVGFVTYGTSTLTAEGWVHAVRVR